MRVAIEPGNTVSFHGTTGKQIGTVENIVLDISNGAKVATVSTTDGETVALPINHLRQEENQ
jgi:sporulation protein YlmC with PRC-barrel domain